jgi:CRP/FNR family transcriptional regulator, cyclic AMP receptor protein
MPADADLLAPIPLFRSLTAEERGVLAALVDVVSIPAGATIFEYGDVGDALYVIRSGQVEVFLTDDTGHRIMLDDAGPGDFFGEIGLLAPGPRTASAVVKSDLEALLVDRQDLEAFLRLHPTAALDLLDVVGQRLRSTNEVLRHTASRNVNEEMADTRSVVQKAADWIAEFSGSIAFFGINVGFFFVWIVVNSGIVPGVTPFDAFPFGLLTMAVSLEAIFLSIFVLISQNRQAAKDRIRADIEYDVNLKAELEIAELHRKVDRLNTVIQERFVELERRQ